VDISTLFTVISGGAALAALGVAISAKFDSQKSNQIAERSEQAAKKSNGLAREANSIAVDARELAKEANTISQRSEARDTEANRVSWDYHWIDSATCEITNTGEDEALNVSITVAVDGEHITHPTVDVEARGGSLRITLPKLADKLHYQGLQFDAEQRRYEASATGRPFYAQGVPPMAFPLKLDVVVTIQWLTPLGKPRERIFEDPGHFFDFA